MALKLFRSTGYSSILSPGETRVAMHPGWMILATSVWTGFVSNLALWHQFAASPAQPAGLAAALLVGAYVAAACGLVLSVLGWRKTLKPASTLLLFLGALSACAAWGDSVAPGLLDARLPGLSLPSWASLMRWQASALVVGLALIPSAWVWHASVRRLPGPKQLRANLTGALLAGALLAGSGFLLLTSRAA